MWQKFLITFDGTVTFLLTYLYRSTPSTAANCGFILSHSKQPKWEFCVTNKGHQDTNVHDVVIYWWWWMSQDVQNDRSAVANVESKNAKIRINCNQWAHHELFKLRDIKVDLFHLFAPGFTLRRHEIRCHAMPKMVCSKHERYSSTSKKEKQHHVPLQAINFESICWYIFRVHIYVFFLSRFVSVFASRWAPRRWWRSHRKRLTL